MNNYISTYALYHPNDAYLEHSLSWGKHRYIKRTGTPGNYKYFYAEDLRNAGRNLASGARGLVTRAGSAISNAFSGARNLVSRGGAAASNAASRVRRTVRNGSQATPTTSTSSKIAVNKPTNSKTRSQRSIKQAFSQKMSSLKGSLVNTGKSIMNKIKKAIKGKEPKLDSLSGVEESLRAGMAAMVSRTANAIGSQALEFDEHQFRKSRENLNRTYSALISGTKGNTRSRLIGERNTAFTNLLNERYGYEWQKHLPFRYLH